MPTRMRVDESCCPQSAATGACGHRHLPATRRLQVLNNIRRGDRDVEVSLPNSDAVRCRTPVIVDDIVSSGRTAIKTVGQLKRLRLPAVFVAIHAVLAQDAGSNCLQLVRRAWSAPIRFRIHPMPFPSLDCSSRPVRNCLTTAIQSTRPQHPSNAYRCNGSFESHCCQGSRQRLLPGEDDAPVMSIR